MNRRQTILSLIACASGVSLSACDNSPVPGRYTQADIDLLAQQQKNDAENSGKGSFGVQRYQGYRGLASLPWFELDERGQLFCVDQDIPMSIDFHCHLGMSLLFEPELDLQRKADRVMHLLDCDAASRENQSRGCDLDLDIYVNGNFSPDDLAVLEDELVLQGLWGSRFAETQTIPNLLSEMDAMRVDQAMVLPIKFDLPFGNQQTQAWRNAVAQAGSDARLSVGFSVHPLANNAIAQMEQHAKQGVKLMKLHPTVQRFYPDDPIALPLYDRAQELGITIFFHGGRAGIEPQSSHRYAMPRHYAKALRDFPKLNFILGHAGARDVDAMLALMLQHKNAWLGIHGQGVTKLDQIIRQTRGQRIVFGSDWPFYHIGASLAKVLLVTDAASQRQHRQALLRDNALALMSSWS